MEISAQYLQSILRDDEPNIKTEQARFETVKLVNHDTLELKRCILKVLMCLQHIEQE